MSLPVHPSSYTDELVIHEDGSVTGWACALNDHLDAEEPLQECAAFRGECARGFEKPFECRSLPR